jgi:CheY-like chemotaxis protein
MAIEAYVRKVSREVPCNSMDDHVSKPVKLEELRVVLESHG